MKIRVVDTESGFDALEEEWNRLSETTSASIFSSFDYVRIAWKHFHKPTDRLFILVFSDEATILGIAPFYIRHSAKWGIPYRIIRLIASWEGDRPRILTTRSERETWSTMLNFLEKDFADWEALELIEQPIEGLTGVGWSFLSRSGWYWESQPDSVDYYISPEGSWEKFLIRLSSTTRRNWRKQTRRLSAAPGGYAVERIADPGRVREALARFKAIEQSGWKAQAKIGVAKDERHQRFYDDLVIRLADKGQVVFHFLTTGQDDAAGCFSFSCRNIIYGRHIAYSPAYAAYSPGMLILAEWAREGFVGPWQELDLLGVKEDGSSYNYKKHWATGKRETIRWTGFRVWSRLLPLIAAKRLKRLFAKQPLCPAEGFDVSATVASDSHND